MSKIGTDRWRDSYIWDKMESGGGVKCVLSDNFHLKGLSHEIDFKTFDKNLQNLA